MKEGTVPAMTTTHPEGAPVLLPLESLVGTLDHDDKTTLLAEGVTDYHRRLAGAAGLGKTRDTDALEIPEPNLG